MKGGPENGEYYQHYSTCYPLSRSVHDHCCVTVQNKFADGDGKQTADHEDRSPRQMANILPYVIPIILPIIPILPTLWC